MSACVSHTINKNVAVDLHSNEYSFITVESTWKLFPFSFFQVEVSDKCSVEAQMLYSSLKFSKDWRYLKKK